MERCYSVVGSVNCRILDRRYGSDGVPDGTAGRCREECRRRVCQQGEGELAAHGRGESARESAVPAERRGRGVRVLVARSYHVADEWVGCLERPANSQIVRRSVPSSRLDVSERQTSKEKSQVVNERGKEQK